MNNLSLVQFVKKAYKEYWFYGYGAHGQVATNQFVDYLINAYPKVNKAYASYLLDAVKNKNRLTDCYGLVKGYLFNVTGDYKYVSEFDVNTDTAYKNAIEKGPLATMPNTKGVILYMKGHVGIYVGDNEFIECAIGKGTIKGKIQKNKIISGSKFTSWFKDKNIKYTDINNIKQENKKLKIRIDNKEFLVDYILKDDYNFIKLRDIADVIGYKIVYNKDKKQIDLYT